MTLVKTGPGWGAATDEGGVHHAHLYDFDIDGATLKDAHKQHLRARAVNLLKFDPERIAWITGKASRTGQENHNVDLSNQRAEEVIAFLHGEGIELSRMSRFGVGSAYALVQGEDARSRAVDVDVTPKQNFPKPPPDPTPPPAPPTPLPPPIDPTARPIVVLLYGVFRVFGRNWTSFPTEQIKIGITNLKSTRSLRIEIRALNRTAPLRTVEFTSGPMTQIGTHEWSWDGYSDEGILDSRLLRDSLLFVYVHTDSGPGFLALKATADDGAPSFADATVYLASKTVDVFVHVDTSRNMSLGKMPSSDEFEQGRSQIKAGIAKYWSRNSKSAVKRNIDVGSSKFEVTAYAFDDGRSGAVKFVVGRWIIVDRSCNWGVILPGAAIDFVVSTDADWQEHTAAHEFGHSVLKDGWGYDYSLRHKGSSTAVQGNVGPPHPAPPAELDLMIYYNGGDTTDFYARNAAIEVDVKALLACVRLKFSTR